MARRRRNRRNDIPMALQRASPRRANPRLLVPKKPQYRVRTASQLIVDRQSRLRSTFLPNLYTPKRLQVSRPLLQSRPLEPVPSARLVNTLNSLNIRPSKPLLKKLSVCSRRHQRREVLFATRKTSAGSASKKTLTSNSKVKC